MRIDTPSVSIPTGDTSHEKDTNEDCSGTEKAKKATTDSKYNEQPKESSAADEPKDDTKGDEKECGEKAGSVNGDEHAACPPIPTNSEATTGIIQSF